MNRRETGPLFLCSAPTHPLYTPTSHIWHTHNRRPAVWSCAIKASCSVRKRSTCTSCKTQTYKHAANYPCHEGVRWSGVIPPHILKRISSHRFSFGISPLRAWVDHTGGVCMVMNGKIPTLLGIESVGSDLPRPGYVGLWDISDRGVNSLESTYSASLYSLDWS
jgi:hypothetical protein